MLSKKVFWDWFKKEVEVRWGKCQFSWTELGDWYWRLEKFDVDTLTQAVRRHKACEDYRSPSLKKVYEYARTITANNRPKRERADGADGSSSGVPEAYTYIMCTAKDERGRGCVGWYVPVLLWPFRTKWTPEDYRRAAEHQCHLHANRAGGGGIWEIFTNTTHLEMMERCAKLRGTKPLNLNPLRKRCNVKPATVGNS